MKTAMRFFLLLLSCFCCSATESERPIILLINSDGRDAELYNLNTDPAETTNCAATETSVVDRLLRAALDWRKILP
jgi:hypothetical protein